MILSLQTLQTCEKRADDEIYLCFSFFFSFFFYIISKEWKWDSVACSTLLPRFWSMAPLNVTTAGVAWRQNRTSSHLLRLQAGSVLFSRDSLPIAAATREFARDLTFVDVAGEKRTSARRDTPGASASACTIQTTQSERRQETSSSLGHRLGTSNDVTKTSLGCSFQINYTNYSTLRKNAWW